MTKIDYLSYLASHAWRARVQEALAAAEWHCQVCGADRWFCRLDVHHNTYRRLGRERPADLLVLCRHCHRIFHEHGKLSRHPED